MQTLDLRTAVSDICQALEADGGGSKSPFFFIVGAGISAGVVPLAAEIEKHCKEAARERGRTAPPPTDQPIDAYSYWFTQAYQQPYQRQEYIRSLIEGKPISAANLRLAHLSLDTTITNLVVTPNFDDFLVRATNLFGGRAVLCDHPATAGRIDPERSDLQIVHVHGSHWFYDCCNLRAEISDRARSSEDTTATMAGLLDRILSRRSPLVIGYSGWEDDVIMSALHRRLSAPLRANLYWFCYRRSDADRLPDWLRDRSDVFLVMPPEPDVSEGGTDSDPEGPSMETKEAVPLDTSGSGGKREEHATLSSQSVLDELVRELGLESPALTSDPLGFLAQQLRAQISGKEDQATTTTYAIPTVIARIERARQAEESLPQAEPAKSLEAVRDALRTSRYRDAIRAGADIDIGSLDEAGLKELMEAGWTAALALVDDSEDELRGYQLVAESADRLIAMDPPGDPALRLRSARTLLFAGFTLDALERWEEAISAYDELLARHAGAEEIALQEQVAKALWFKGSALGELGRLKEALETYDEVVARFGEAKEATLREPVANALVSKGVRLERDEEALGVYDEVVARFGEAEEAGLLRLVARALVFKGMCLGSLGRNEEALGAYGEVVARFGEAEEAGLLEEVADALVRKGRVLRKLGRYDEVIAAYEDIVTRFGDAEETDLLIQVAEALVSKGRVLRDFGKSAEAIAACEEVLTRFQATAEPSLLEWVEQAKDLRQEIDGDGG